MKTTGLIYLVLGTMAVFVGVLAIVPLYRGGSKTVPGWTAFVDPGPLSERHAFLSGNCEGCHTPLRGVEAKTCIACHAPAMAGLARQATAFHAGIQDCSGCHVEHTGAARPTRMDHAALARIASRQAGHPGPDLSRQIARDVAAYLGIKPRDHADSTRGLDCVSCHANQDRHRQFFGRDCADCHATDSWRIQSFLHPSPRSTECAQCHEAPPSHYMGHFHMVSRMVARQPTATVEQCQLCHVPSSFNEIKDVGWYKHH